MQALHDCTLATSQKDKACFIASYNPDAMERTMELEYSKVKAYMTRDSLPHGCHATHDRVNTAAGLTFLLDIEAMLHTNLVEPESLTM